MKNKYGLIINNQTICDSLIKITNQVYKLLPYREEGKNWELPLQTILVEVNGLFRLFPSLEKDLFPILCKLEGLNSIKSNDNFFFFRRMIFDVLNLINGVLTNVRTIDE